MTIRSLSARVAMLLVLVAGVTITPGCRSLDAATVPPEVVQLTVNRGVELASVEQNLASMTDAQLANVLDVESAAWKYVEDALGFATPADLKSAAQSQKIATEVAAGKLRRGEYNDAQKQDLVTALRQAWAGLTRYYSPE